MIEIPSDLHPDLVPLVFLLGNWQGAGVFDFPGSEKCNFGQEVTFTHDGRDFLEYVSHTWVLDADGEKVRPAGDRVRLLAHRRRPQGRGRDGPRPGRRRDLVRRARRQEAADRPGHRRGGPAQLRGPYTGGKRLYGYVKSDLMWVGEKATPEVELRPYMSAHLKKVVTPGRGDGPRTWTTCRTTASPSSSRTARARGRPVTWDFAGCRRAGSYTWARGEHRLEERPARARLPADAAAAAGAGGRRRSGHATPDDILVRGAADRGRGQHLHRLPDPGAAGGAGPGQPRPPGARRADVPPGRPPPPHPPGLPGLRRRSSRPTWRSAAQFTDEAAGTIRLRDRHEALRDLRPLCQLRTPGRRCAGS